MSEVLTKDGPAEGRGRLAPPRARIGLIIPAVNTMSEPQFAHFCPTGLGVYTTRLRMSGKWKGPLADIRDRTVEAANLLADAHVDLIVFHCTGTSMREGPQGDADIRDLIRDATGVETITTGGAVVEALSALGMRRLVLVTPYVQSSNDREIAYLAAVGVSVVHDVALGLKGGDEYTTITPTRWVDIAVENDRADADGYFLSCTNTRQIESVDAIERRTGKPVVNSNQAVIWASLDRLRAKLGPLGPMPGPGRLMVKT